MVSIMVLRIPWGIISDKYGYVKELKLSLPIIATSSFLRSFSPNYYVLLFSQFLLGIGFASILPCLTLLVRDLFPLKTGVATGVYTSGFALGNGTALGLTPYLLKIFEWRDILFYYSIFAVFITILYWIVSEESAQTNKKIDKNIFKIIKKSHVLILIFFMIAAMGCYDTLATWIPKILEFKFLSKYPAILLSLGFLLSGPIIGTVSDKFTSDKFLIGLLGVLSFLSIIGIILLPPPLLWGSIFLTGFFLMGNLTLTLKEPAKNDKLKQSAGKVTGIISSIGNIGPIFIPVLFGYLIDITYTYILSMIIVGLIALATFVSGSYLLRE